MARAARAPHVSLAPPLRTVRAGAGQLEPDGLAAVPRARRPRTRPESRPRRSPGPRPHRRPQPAAAASPPTRPPPRSAGGRGAASPPPRRRTGRRRRRCQRLADQQLHRVERVLALPSGEGLLHEAAGPGHAGELRRQAGGGHVEGVADGWSMPASRRISSERRLGGTALERWPTSRPDGRDTAPSPSAKAEVTSTVLTGEASASPPSVDPPSLPISSRSSRIRSG